MAIKKQMSEAYSTGALLAVVGGYLDAYTYFGRGHVFANAQTGNIVLMGIHLAAGDWVRAVYYFIPILSFFLGIVIAEMIKSRFRESENIHWRQIVIVIETVILLGVAFIPQGNTDMVANILISFVCSLQVETFRKVNGNKFATTMCTGNLRSAAEHLYHYKKTKDKAPLHNSLQYIGIILFFITGAIIGSLVTHIYEAKSVLFACIGLFFVFVIMFIKSPESTEEFK